MKTSIVWFRNDLRLRDNATLTEAITHSDQIIPVYVFDPSRWRNLDLGFQKTGPFQTEFLLESVQCLKENLQEAGSDLLIKTGDPVKIISELVREYEVDAVYASKEATWEEIKQEKELQKELESEAVDLQLIWQSTLFHVDDLVQPVSELPDVFTSFRKKQEKYADIRKEMAVPNQIISPTLPLTIVPGLNEFGFSESGAQQDERTAIHLVGGEKAAWSRLNHYFWDSDQLKSYKWTRNGLLGEDYSSKFSPWLAHGCISPRSIYHEVKRYERERKKNVSTYWLVFELIWRDYFRFVCLKYGRKVFYRGGIKDLDREYSNDLELFEKWKNGETGQSFVDANMKELKLTGFMSNRGRQNVASFLVKDLNIDWRWGAAWFEHMLTDYDVCSNWGNWMYVAGVGNDPRENRYFNVLNQAEKYDPKGEFVQHWLQPNLFSKQN